LVTLGRILYEYRKGEAVNSP